MIDTQTLPAMCCWWDRGGWYWDDAEDHGGFDRASPNGPCGSKCEAQADAENLLGPCTWFDGTPGHY